MIKIPIAIIGAGGMGGRHLRALGALYESGMANVELVAVCDKRKENANFLDMFNFPQLKENFFLIILKGVLMDFGPSSTASIIKEVWVKSNGVTKK